MTDRSMSAYALAVSLYDKSDKVGIPLHERDKTIQQAWISVAQRLIAAGTVPMETPNTVI